MPQPSGDAAGERAVGSEQVEPAPVRRGHAGAYESGASERRELRSAFSVPTKRFHSKLLMVWARGKTRPNLGARSARRGSQ